MRLHSCCFAFSLRVGTAIIVSLSLLFAIIDLSLYQVWALTNLRPGLLLIILGIWLNIFTICCVIVAYVAIFQKNAQLLLPFVIMSLVNIVFSILIAVINLNSEPPKDYIIRTVRSVVIIVQLAYIFLIQVYFLAVVFSYYLALDDDDDDRDSSMYE